MNDVDIAKISSLSSLSGTMEGEDKSWPQPAKKRTEVQPKASKPSNDLHFPARVVISSQVFAAKSEKEGRSKKETPEIKVNFFLAIFTAFMTRLDADFLLNQTKFSWTIYSG